MNKLFSKRLRELAFFSLRGCVNWLSQGYYRIVLFLDNPGNPGIERWLSHLKITIWKTVSLICVHKVEIRHIGVYMGKKSIFMDTSGNRFSWVVVLDPWQWISWEYWPLTSLSYSFNISFTQSQHAEQLLISCLSLSHLLTLDMLKSEYLLLCHISHVTCLMSNAYVDHWDMLNNFCFHVYAQTVSYTHLTLPTNREV